MDITLSQLSPDHRAGHCRDHDDEARGEDHRGGARDVPGGGGGRRRVIEQVETGRRALLVKGLHFVHWNEQIRYVMRKTFNSLFASSFLFVFSILVCFLDSKLSKQSPK